MFTFLSDRNKTAIAPSTIIFITFFWLGLFFLYYIHQVLIMLFLAVILMSALNPAVSWLERKIRLPRALGIGLVYTLVFIVIGFLLWIIIPPLVEELDKLLQYYGLPVFIRDSIQNFKFTLNEFSLVFNNWDLITNSLNTFLSVILPAITGLFTFVSIIVMSVFLVFDRQNLYKKVKWFTKDESHVALAKEFIDTAEYQLGGWIRGQLILMLVIGVITYLGLSLLGIPYALPLATLAAFLEMIPNTGPTITSIPAILLGLATGGWFSGLVTAGFYVVVQQLENNLIVPKVMRDNVDVNPLVAMVAILIGFKVGNVVGALLALPVYIVLRTLYGMWYRRQ